MQKILINSAGNRFNLGATNKTRNENKAQEDSLKIKFCALKSDLETQLKDIFSEAESSNLLNLRYNSKQLKSEVELLMTSPSPENLKNLLLIVKEPRSDKTNNTLLTASQVQDLYQIGEQMKEISTLGVAGAGGIINGHPIISSFAALINQITLSFIDTIKQIGIDYNISDKGEFQIKVTIDPTKGQGGLSPDWVTPASDGSYYLTIFEFKSNQLPKNWESLTKTERLDCFKQIIFAKDDWKNPSKWWDKDGFIDRLVGSNNDDPDSGIFKIPSQVNTWLIDHKSSLIFIPPPDLEFKLSKLTYSMIFAVEKLIDSVSQTFDAASNAVNASAR